MGLPMEYLVVKTEKQDRYYRNRTETYYGVFDGEVLNDWGGRGINDPRLASYWGAFGGQNFRAASNYSPFHNCYSRGCQTFTYLVLKRFVGQLIRLDSSFTLTIDSSRPAIVFSNSGHQYLSKYLTLLEDAYKFMQDMDLEFPLSQTSFDQIQNILHVVNTSRDLKSCKAEVAQIKVGLCQQEKALCGNEYFTHVLKINTSPRRFEFDDEQIVYLRNKIAEATSEEARIDAELRTLGKYFNDGRRAELNKKYQDLAGDIEKYKKSLEKLTDEERRQENIKRGNFDAGPGPKFIAMRQECLEK